MAELEVTIVAVDHGVWDGNAESVVLKTVEGDMGVLPNHEPVLAILADGPVRVDPVDGDPIYFAVHGGFFSLDSNKVSILAETAEAASDIDVERAKAAKARAEAAGADDEEEAAALKRADVRLAVAALYGSGNRRR